MVWMNPDGVQMVSRWCLDGIRVVSAWCLGVYREVIVDMLTNQ